MSVVSEQPSKADQAEIVPRLYHDCTRDQAIQQRLYHVTRIDSIPQKQGTENHPTITLTLAPPVVLDTVQKPSK